MFQAFIHIKECGSALRADLVISKFELKDNSSGFTLVEIMVVVAIIGLLAAIAIPSFVKARTQAKLNACSWNIKVIKGAIERYSMDANLGENDNVVDAQGTGSIWGWQTYLKDGQLPICSAGNANNGNYYYTQGDESTPGSDGIVADYTVVCPNYNATKHDPY
jgi:prepilin-type N-terminal cleavage/methylation domain-containing protein